MGKRILAEGEIYHVYNRGADKRKIFIDDKDRLRFVHDLFEFNDEKNVVNAGYCFSKNPVKVAGIGKYNSHLVEDRDPRKILVDVLVFVIMPNHFHLLLRQKKKDGITRFMRKLGAGYALYFNERYRRSGVLFQGRFKSVRISKNHHLVHIPYYIHANPLDLREEKDVDEMKFLNSYRWSSHIDYCGWRNFPSVTQRSFLLDFFGGEESYRQQVKKWLEKKARNVEKVRDVALEKFAVALLVLALSWQVLSLGD